MDEVQMPFRSLCDIWKVYGVPDCLMLPDFAFCGKCSDCRLFLCCLGEWNFKCLKSKFNYDLIKL